MPEPYQLSVAEAAGEIRSGSLSPVELAQSLLGRIDALEPSLRAWVTIDREEVLTEAKRREDELGQGTSASTPSSWNFLIKASAI